MLDAQVMPFMSNSTGSGYRYDHPPIIATYKNQDNNYESYATRFHHSQDQLQHESHPLMFSDEYESSQRQRSCVTPRYETLTSSAKHLVDVATQRLSNVRDESKTRYFDHLKEDVSEKDPNEEMEEEEEDVDDDEFLEEEYADAYRAQMTPDSPTRLLRFIGTVTAEIQSRFTRNKGNDDYCDVYEERFKTTLSGREMYYADLLALASNSEAPSTSRRNRLSTTAIASSTTAKRSKDHTVIYDPSGNAKSYTLPHEGRQIHGCGLGPLEELFRCGLAWKVSTTTSNCSVSFKDNAILAPVSPLASSSLEYNKNNKGYELNRNDIGYSFPNVPMTMRKLPSSFWEEPGCRNRDHVILPSVNNTPDFTDLFDQWTDKC